ncbi:hypothetical protein [Pseudoalteromonas sp. S3431]|uniref:hypothetical protein n=1 Tax=Pseudoalteromonas sp. S3431 TaxID=579537 RepID=UPI0004A19B8B|nr:hypothetical protein [Pseudoalteromonas sp. S3431]KDC55375.1 hypothetical protein DO88_03785 [Pseudoalteromonas sp. S3431]
MSEEMNSIDVSIEALESYVGKNQESARRLLTYLMMFSISILMVIMMLYIFPTAFLKTAEVTAKTEVSRIPESVLYGLFVIFVVVFGVLMAVYRFHLNEIARSEHYKMGFMRIRVAANNHTDQGFNSEVRESLTNDAFIYNPSTVFSSKDKKVDSPLPGHPSSDLTAIVLNKLLDGIDLKKK